MDREKTIENLKHQLDRLNQELDLLEASAKKIEADVKLSYMEKLTALRAKRDRLRDRLRQIEAGGEDLLRTLTHEFEVARSALEASIKEFRGHYED